MSRFISAVHYHTGVARSGIWSRLFASASGKVTLSSATPLTFEEFEEYRAKKSATIIDLRQPEELVSDGIIPRATNIPMAEVESAFRMSTTEFESKYGVMKPRQDDPVIFLCRRGIRAAEANDFVRWTFKYNNTAVYSGSQDWNAKMGKTQS